MNDSGGTRGSEAYCSITETMNGHEELNQWRGREPGATCSTPLSRHSHNASGFTSSSSSLRPGRRPKGLVPEEVSGHHSPDAGFGIGIHGNTGHRPSSAEFSRNTSNSGSPISSKGSLDCLQGRSVSLSSDDVVGLSHEGSRLSQTSLIPRSSTLPCDSPSAQRSSLRPASHRPASPGSEMVSLEEFLQESNALSPPTVHTGSREDLMTDFFARSTRSAPLRDDPKTPTSYVTPTIKTTPEQDCWSPKPGHSVKPNVRLNETSTPPSHSQTLPNRGGGHRPSPQHQSSPRGGAGSGRSLSRTFSLASADLLHSNGPDSYCTDGVSPCQNDVVLRRSGGVARERPMSARMAGDPGHLSVDPRRLSLAPPRDEPLRSPLALHSSSVSMQAEREYVESRGSRTGGVRSGSAQSRPSSHRGEVAMVTPVRAVSALRLKDLEEEPQELRQADSPVLKTADTPNVSYGAKEQATSKPASPDPNNDPQTVWYEYGCV